jgi:glycosyltransferase involved in cell wall biosynthesis
VQSLFVVVPFWNCEDLLRRCLASLDAQTHAATIVLIDDASDAPARELAKSYCNRARGRIYLARTDNGGPAAARHDGLRWVLENAASDDDIVVLLDGDDELAQPQALATITAVYAADRRVQLSLGGHRRTSGKAVYRRRYERWHFDLGLVRAAPWRARPPRTFRVGLLRRAWPRISWRWPNGSWVRSGTDVLLVLPMLALLRWHELVQLEEVLYVYNDVRPDGTTIEATAKGRWRQLGAEAYVRRSLAWALVTLPKRLLMAASGQLARRVAARRVAARRAGAQHG